MGWLALLCQLLFFLSLFCKWQLTFIQHFSKFTEPISPLLLAKDTFKHSQIHRILNLYCYMARNTSISEYSWRKAYKIVFENLEAIINLEELWVSKWESNIFTHSLPPRCTVLLEQLTGLQPVTKFPAFHGTRRFITALTSVATCLYPGPAQSSPYIHIPRPGDPS